MESLKYICKAFKLGSEVESIRELTSGHINDSFLVKTVLNQLFVLQKINAKVFKNIEDVILNKVVISEHLFQSKTNYDTVQFIKTHTDEPYFIDAVGQYWNVMTYIPNSITHSIANSPQLVEEAGKLYGDFLLHTANLKPNRLRVTIPDFHSIPERYKQFNQALKLANEHTKTTANTEIELVLSSYLEMGELSGLIDKKVLPIRVTHNDTKLSNILFDENNKGLAVIDLDTVMAGIVAFDFGDSVRSICSTTTEDDTNLEGTTINLEYYQAFCRGYASKTKHILKPTEKDYLPLGAKTITFIMGLRFLTDYLNNNCYFKVDYEAHNLHRAKNQFKLVKSIQEQFQRIKQITELEFT